MRLAAFIILILSSPGLPSAQGIDADNVAAIAAAEDGWDLAYSMSDDAVTRDVLTWLRLREGAGTFNDYNEFITDHPQWPGLDRLRAQSEAAIVKGADPETVIAWFAEIAPQTGEGALRLAEAYTTNGQPDEARNILRDAWLSIRLTNETQTALITAFGDVLEPFHIARTDAMLWRWRTTDARRMLGLLDNDHKALAAARIAYISKSGDRAKLLRAVPRSLSQDPGLAYDRYNWLADQGNRTEAVKILLDRSTSRAALGEPFRWAGWRRSLARWEMREGRTEQAYILASRHYLDDGAAFADLEWLSGYISLTYLDDPTQALEHFEKAASVVDTPISVGRMQYWIGRAQEMLGADDLAEQAFTLSSAHQTSFYGLLAAERLGLSLNPSFAAQDVDWTDATVFDQDLTQAALLLLDAGQRGHATTFFAKLAKTLDADELAQLGAFLNDRDEQYYTLLLGKSAAAEGIIAPQVYFPTHDLADMELPVSPALALSIARRESEFNIGIGSPVGALGLMQLMPGTAQEVSGFLDIPYSRFRLTSDWRYNATLGAKYLSILQEEFGNTPVMIAAGYNAGPSRPRTWMDERGDPRLGEIDVVDWIEHIPFRETRNYVQRVTESLPVYQARLTGQTGPIEFTKLLVGIKPLLRPRARPLPQFIGDVPTVRPATRPLQEVVSDDVPGLRPIARPEPG